MCSFVIFFETWERYMLLKVGRRNIATGKTSQVITRVNRNILIFNFFGSFLLVISPSTSSSTTSSPDNLYCHRQHPSHIFHHQNHNHLKKWPWQTLPWLWSHLCPCQTTWKLYLPNSFCKKQKKNASSFSTFFSSPVLICQINIVNPPAGQLHLKTLGQFYSCSS